MNRQLRNFVTLGAASLGAIGAARAINSFLPRRFATWYEPEDTTDHKASSPLPNVEVSFLRCGRVSVPEPLAVRGAFSLAPCLISHSAVLIRHPKATF